MRLSIFLILTFHQFAVGSSEDDLDNMIIERKIEFDFPYSNGGYLDVFKDPKYDRYYVTPLCELVSNSVKCLENGYKTDHPYIVILPIRLWSDHVAQTAALEAQKRNKSAILDPSHFGVLPLKSARLITHIQHYDFGIPVGFSPNVRNEGQVVKFHVYPTNKDICEKMVKDAKDDPENFLYMLNLYFEYTMKVGKQEGREVKVTSQSLTNSEAFSIINNTYENKNGVVYLTSSDMNKFSKEVLTSIKIIDVSTQNHVTMEEEDRLIHDLIRGLQEERVSSSKLSRDEWDSVFWNDLFTRPDIETSYLEKTFTFDQGKDRYIYNSENEKEFFGHLQDKLEEYKNKSWAGKLKLALDHLVNNIEFCGSASAKSSSVEDFKKDWQNITSTAQRNALSKDVLSEFLKKSGKNVEITGEKFTPKGLELHRVNTNNLLVKGEIFYDKSIRIAVNATIRNKIRPEFVEEDVNAVPSSSFYEELKRIENITNNLEALLLEQKSNLEQKMETIDGKFDSLNMELRTFINDRLATQRNEFDSIWRTNLENTENSIRTKSTELENKIRGEYLTKQLYHDSLGLLPHENNYIYNALHRRRLCQALGAFHPIIGWGTSENGIWPTWNFLVCGDFYEYVDPHSPFRSKNDW